MQPTTPHLLDSIPTLEQDIPASSFMVAHFWLWVLLGLALAIVIAVLAFLWWRAKQRRRPAAVESPLQSALRALDALEEELPPLRPCSLRLSMLLRTYLAGKTSDPALYETHEEFSQRMDSLENVPASCRYETRTLLEDLAAYKYAGQTEAAPNQARALIERSRKILIRLDEARNTEEKGGAA